MGSPIPQEPCGHRGVTCPAASSSHATLRNAIAPNASSGLFTICLRNALLLIHGAAVGLVEEVIAAAQRPSRLAAKLPCSGVMIHACSGQVLLLVLLSASRSGLRGISSASGASGRHLWLAFPRRNAKPSDALKRLTAAGASFATRCPSRSYVIDVLPLRLREAVAAKHPRSFA